MPFHDSLSHPLAEAGVERRALGVSRHPGTGHAKRRGEVWVVFHGDWTGVWRVDPRDGRTVFLERALDGDRRDEAVRWAVEAFAIAPPERAEARVFSAANSDGDSPLDAARRAAG